MEDPKDAADVAVQEARMNARLPRRGFWIWRELDEGRKKKGQYSRASTLTRSALPCTGGKKKRLSRRSMRAVETY